MIIFYCLEVIKVCNHLLICHLLCPEALANKIHYCGKILGETDLIDFIDLLSCTG